MGMNENKSQCTHKTNIYTCIYEYYQKMVGFTFSEQWFRLQEQWFCSPEDYKPVGDRERRVTKDQKTDDTQRFEGEINWVICKSPTGVKQKAHYAQIGEYRTPTNTKVSSSDFAVGLGRGDVIQARCVQAIQQMCFISTIPIMKLRFLIPWWSFEIWLDFLTNVIIMPLYSF